MRVKFKKDLTLGFWRNNVDALLEFNDYPVLSDAGNRIKKEMEHYTSEQYSIYDQFYKDHMKSGTEERDLSELDDLSKRIKGLSN